jgi:CubicO group peptidase (beta-lactamase class C family)
MTQEPLKNLPGSAGRASLDEGERGALFWSLERRDAAFRAMTAEMYPAGLHVIEPGASPRPLPPGPPLKLALDVDAWMDQQRNAALLVVQGGRLRLERHGLGLDGHGSWVSFSVAKSFTSTLVGAALRDGAIASLDDKVSDYIAEMKGSPYDGVSVRQLLTMTSGVQWNEDYADPGSDVVRFGAYQPESGEDPVAGYMRRLPRAEPAGTRWNYSTGETNLIGTLVRRATGKTLAHYLQEKVWQPAGMAGRAYWALDRGGHEIGGCCLLAAPHDYARFGLFILEGARVDGRGVLPDGYLAEATTQRAAIGEPGRGYGYQWWTYDDGGFAARGIFGQGIFIDPQRQLVITVNGNWNSAVDEQAKARREAFYQAVREAVDDEA